MSEESAEHKENTQDESLDDLVQQIDQKKQELQEKRQKENPDNRLTGYTLLNHFMAITGKHPFTGDRVGQGIGERRYPDSPLFSTKLNKNLKEIRENLTVLNSVIPSLEESEREKFNEYLEKHDEIVKKNCGVEEPEEYDEDELKALANRKGNKELYEKEIQELKEDYQDIIDKNKEVSEERDEVLKKPLLKCEFDMIKESDVQNTGLSVVEQDSINAMLDY